MIILLYGKDTYRKKEKLDKIIEQYKKKFPSGLNIKFVSDNKSFSDVTDKQISMFGEKKLVVINDSFNKSLLKESISKNIDSLKKSDDIIVLFEESITKSDSLLKKVIKSDCLVQEFNLLPRSGVLTFLKKEVKNKQGEISDEAMQTLIDYTGNDLWRLKNEIDKLFSYSSKITEDDVKKLVKPEIETNIFKTIDALAERDKKKATGLIYEHIVNGDHALYIISMIVYQFRNLLIVRSMIDEGVPSEKFSQLSGIHPFVARKTGFQASKFSGERLKQIYNRLFEIDTKVKTGQLDPVMAIHLIIFEF